MSVITGLNIESPLIKDPNTKETYLNMVADTAYSTIDDGIKDQFRILRKQTFSILLQRIDMRQVYVRFHTEREVIASIGSYGFLLITIPLLLVYPLIQVC